MRSRASRLFVVAVVVVVAVIVVAAVLLRGRLRCAGFAGPGVTAEELPPAAQPGDLRIVNWNIRNYPLDERPQEVDLGYSRRTNICDLEAVLGGLDADILGVAEIRDTRRFPPILRRAGSPRDYRIELSRWGGEHGQRVGVAWDDRVLELVGEPTEISEVALDDPALRPALAVQLRGRTDRHVDLLVIQVHLKSAPSGYERRVRQYRALARWVRESGHSDVVVMGDFNTTGELLSREPIRVGPVDAELAVADRILAAAGLRRLPNATGCSEYWEGPGGRDGVQVPSLLDHVYVRGVDRLGPDAAVHAWLHCFRHACQDLVSRPGEEDGTFWDVSDHCPITVDVPGLGS
jgi:endonuclease/exonuclease/phosphatase family metal-dependent hydrolase